MWVFCSFFTICVNAGAMTTHLINRNLVAIKFIMHDSTNIAFADCFSILSVAV